MLLTYTRFDPMEQRGYQQMGEDVRQGRWRDAQRFGCITCLVPLVLIVAFVIVTFTVSSLNDIL